jgi:protein disulfide-isomerase A1
MRSLLLAILFSAMLLGLHAHEGHEGHHHHDEVNETPGETHAEVPDDVIVLTDANYDEEVAKHEHLLIEFYAPWCGHCQTLAPEYSKAATILKEEGLHLAKIDATANEGLAKRFEVQGFPTIKYYKKGEYSEYHGGRTTEDIVQWFRKKVGPVSKESSGPAEIEELRTKHSVLVVFFGENPEKFRTFIDVASHIEDINFAHCKSKECIDKYEVKTPYEVRLFKHFDEGVSRLFAFDTSDELRIFIEESSVPLVAHFDERIADYIFGKNKNALFFLRADNDHTHDDLIKELAAENRGKLIFVACDIKGELEARLAEYFGLTDQDLPHIRIVSVKADDDVPVFVFREPINEDNLRTFIKDFNEGKLEPFFKSDPVPETQEGPVYVLVGKTFTQEVLESGKNVLVEFYAPWCGFCQKLEPQYNKLAEAYKGVSNLMIAKIDSTANEAEGAVIEGFPTIKLYKAGDRKPINFEGAASGSALSKFLNENLGLDIVYVPGDEEKEAETQEGQGHEHEHEHVHHTEAEGQHVDL